MDTAVARRPFVHRRMDRTQALDIVIRFGRATHGLIPVQPKLTPDGKSYDAQIPMQFVEEIAALLDRRG